MKKIKYISILLLTLLVTIGFRMDVFAGCSDSGATCEVTIDKENQSELYNKIMSFIGSRYSGGKLVERQDGIDVYEEAPGSCATVSDEFKASYNFLNGDYDCLAIGNTSFNSQNPMDFTNDWLFQVGLKGSVFSIIPDYNIGKFQFQFRTQGGFFGIQWGTLFYNIYTDKLKNGKKPEIIVFEMTTATYAICGIGNNFWQSDTKGVLTCHSDNIEKKEFYKLVVAKVFYLDDEDIDGDGKILKEKAEAYVNENPESRFMLKTDAYDENVTNVYKQCVKDNQGELDDLLRIAAKIPDFSLLDKSYETSGVSRDEIINRMIGQLLPSSAYFDNQNVDIVISEMKSDLETINGIMNGEMNSCLYEAYVGKACTELNKEECIGEGLRLHKSRYNDFPGNYAELLRRILSRSEDDIKTIFTAKNVSNDQHEVIDNYECKNFAGPTSAVAAQRNVCLVNSITDDFENISCDNLASQEFNSAEESVNQLMKYIYKRAEKECQKSNNKQQCIKMYCEDTKNNSKTFAYELVSGTTPEQNAANNIYASMYEDLYDAKRLEIISGKEEFCKRLISIQEYIFGGLNLIRIAGPIITIILTIMDGIKTFVSFKDDESKKFLNHLYKRLICVAILFLVPTIINFLLGFIIPLDEVCQLADIKG